MKMRAKKYIVASFLFCFILFGITVCASAKVKTNGEYESARGSNRPSNYKFLRLLFFHILYPLMNKDLPFGRSLFVYKSY